MSGRLPDAGQTSDLRMAATYLFISFSARHNLYADKRVSAPKDYHKTAVLHGQFD